MNQDLDTLIARQQALTDALLSTLDEHGVTEGMELQVDVFFTAPSREIAGKLLGYLAENSAMQWQGYEHEGRNGICTVVSEKNPLIVTRDGMLRLAEALTTVGFEWGCSFDGFGAELPTRTATNGLSQPR